MAPTAKKTATTTAKKTSAKKATAKKTTAKATGRTASSAGFTAEERSAMRDRAAELKAQRTGADGEKDLLEKIEAMGEADREVAAAVHRVVMAAAPGLEAKTWYGMPAYAKDGKTLCFFQNAGKFKARYSMLGFSDVAALDDGDIWPVYYAVPAMTPGVEQAITDLIRRAVG